MGGWVRMGLASGLFAICSASYADAAPFDGTWDTRVECPKEPTGGAAYTLQFLSTIKDGRLHGQYGIPGKIPSETFDGQIDDSGSGMLHVVGLAGDPKYNINNVPLGTPIDYQASLHFDASRGSGERVSGRPCRYIFIRK